jgi:hypothetical protein
MSTDFLILKKNLTFTFLFTPEKLPYNWNFQFNGAFRTDFLAAVAPDADFIVMDRRPGLVIINPIHGFWIRGADGNAHSTRYTLFFFNIWSWYQPVINKMHDALWLE